MQGRSSKRGTLLLITLFILVWELVACAGEGPPAPTSVSGQAAETPTVTLKSAAGLEVLEVTFAHGLTEEMAPVEPGEEFTPDATIYLSVKLKGRPKEGRVTARFLYRDQEFAATTVDLAQAWEEQGLIFAIGGNTFVGFTLKPEEALPIGEDYRVELLLNDTPAGSYTFKVVPPPEAIPSQVRQATLARGATEDYEPIEPGDVFAPQDKVYLVGRVDLGLYSSLEVRWYVDGKLDEAGTRTMTAQENLENSGFYFAYLPDQGWPEGEHKVVLVIDDQEVATYSFTVREIPPTSTPPPEETLEWREFGDPYDPESLLVMRYPAYLDLVEESKGENRYGYVFRDPEDTETLAIALVPLDSQPLDDATWEEVADALLSELVPMVGDDAEIVSRSALEELHLVTVQVVSEAEQHGGLIALQEDRGVVMVRFWRFPKERWEQRLQQWEELEITWFPARVHRKFDMWTPYEEALGFFTFSRPPQLDQEEELTEPPVGYMFKSSETGEGLVFVYSDVTDTELEAVFRYFVQDLRVQAFGENLTATVDKGQDAQGFPVTITEFTSEDGTRKGLEVVWEPQQGIQAYFLWMAPAELWDERYRDETVLQVFQSLRWSPERIREYYDRFYLFLTPTPEAEEEPVSTRLVLPEGASPIDLAWDPAGRWIAVSLGDASSESPYLVLYDAQTYEPLAGPGIRASQLAFSPDGALLATTYRQEDRQDHLAVWETATLLEEGATPKSTFTGRFGGVFDLAFSPDGRWIALAVSAAQGSLVPVVDAETGDVVQMLEFPYQGVHAPIVEEVSFSPDGAHLAAIAYGGTAQVWRTEDWQPVATVETGITGDPNTILFLSPEVFLTNGVSDEGVVIHVWRVDGTLKTSIPAPERIEELALSSTGNMLFAVGPSGAHVLISEGEFFSAEGAFRRLTFSPDDERVAIVTGEEEVLICDLGLLLASLCG